MPEDYLTYPIPSFAKPEAYNFTPEKFELYQELNAISEEIAKCRAKALQ